MEERSLKRLAVMFATAIVIILVLKHVGLKMATSAKAAHDQQVATRQANARASAPAPSPLPDTGQNPDSLVTLPADDSMTASAPDSMPTPASEPAFPEDAPAPADPTVSTPPASLAN